VSESSGWNGWPIEQWVEHRAEYRVVHRVEYRVVHRVEHRVEHRVQQRVGNGSETDTSVGNGVGIARRYVDSARGSERHGDQPQFVG
jgi:hypothetical protein